MRPASFPNMFSNMLPCILGIVLFRCPWGSSQPQVTAVTIGQLRIHLFLSQPNPFHHLSAISKLHSSLGCLLVLSRCVLVATQYFTDRAGVPAPGERRIVGIVQSQSPLRICIRSGIETKHSLVIRKITSLPSFRRFEV